MIKYLPGAALLAGMLVPAMWAADSLTPLSIKPGEWEMTRTTQTTGAPPIPAELLDKMTPEQKARMDAAMKARAAKGATTKTDRRCITKEDLNKPFVLDDQKSCKPTIFTSNGSMEDFRLDCNIEGMKATSKIHVVAESSESMKATADTNATDGTHTMNVQGTVTGKWIGPVCSASSKQ